MNAFDCMRCGACCRNPAENREEGSVEWVEVAPSEPLAGKPAHAKLLVANDDGVLHLRLVDGGRCIALRGAIGKKVSCSIYSLRPRGCRRVEAGDRSCLRYRAEAGLS
ncbi:MAG TPA: YkgJ family cysteine cluster protein [Nannocystaceae bacterium]|nr:YkgJ family cysteine cluster protein [Nannocystaceae bacterium]